MLRAYGDAVKDQIRRVLKAIDAAREDGLAIGVGGMDEFDITDFAISVTLANADSHFSEIERETGFRGAQVTIQFLFYDLAANAAASEARVVFRGIGEFGG